MSIFRLAIPHNVGCVQAFWPLLALEIDCIAFIQRFEAILLNGGEVDKYILTRGTLNKSITFGTIKPFNYTTFRHNVPLMLELHS